MSDNNDVFPLGQLLNTFPPEQLLCTKLGYKRVLTMHDMGWTGALLSPPLVLLDAAGTSGRGRKNCVAL